MKKLLLWLSVGLWLVPAAEAQQRFDAAQLLTDLRVLSADSLEGRRTGSPGNRKAQAYIRQAYEAYGLQPFGDRYAQPFTFSRDDTSYDGLNLVGYVEGTAYPTSYIVMTAHYDHLGIKDGEIYNGADDNASGVAGLLAAASYFAAHPPEHTIIFAALDAEELGLQGAHALVRELPVALDRVLLNVNLDMVSRSAEDELYAAGTYHYPELKPYLEQVAAQSKIHLRFGHDRPDLPAGDDWTKASDHGVFHAAGVPFVYFGVEDHPGYHKPSDDYVEVTPAFFIRAVDTILDALLVFDTRLDEHRAPSGE